MGWESLRWHLEYTGQSVQSKEALVTAEWIHGTHYSSNREAWSWQGEGPEVLNHFFLEVKLGHVWVKSAEKDVSNHCVLGWDAGHKVRTASGPWTVAFCVPIFASLSLVFSLTQEDNSIWRKQVGFWHHWGWHCSLGNGGASFFFFSDPSSKGKMLWPSVKDFSLSTGNKEMSSPERGFTFI